MAMLVSEIVKAADWRQGRLHQDDHTDHHDGAGHPLDPTPTLALKAL
jgi:hypothetical protein